MWWRLRVAALAAGLALAGSSRGDLKQALAEPNLEKRSKLALDHAEQTLKSARSAYGNGENQKATALIAEVVEAVQLAEDSLKEKIFRNMSQRAAEMLKDDLESRGPVRLSEVEGAQKEILAMVRKMAEAGTVQLGGKGEEFV